MGSDAACADNQPALTFDAETHTYRIDGERVPSVTQVLEGAGLIDTRWFNDEARTRGTYVALATQYYDEGTLDYDALDDELKPYVMAWERFLAGDDTREVLRIEQRVWHTALRFAGTLDRTILMGTTKRKYVLDIKTGSAAPWHQLQTAGYAECLVGLWCRASIILYDDASYHFNVHDSRSDRDVFRSALNLYHWKSENGLL